MSNCYSARIADQRGVGIEMLPWEIYIVNFPLEIIAKCQPNEAIRFLNFFWE